jgi:hypothetical protein
VSIWTKPKYPGDAVRIVMLHRNGEIGDIRIQQYDNHVTVGTFLPGVIECSPGDTPKTRPEKSETCVNSFLADDIFDRYLAEAYEEFWQDYYPWLRTYRH